MIKIWTWQPLEPKCFYAQDIEQAVTYVDKEIDAYEAEQELALEQHNAKLAMANTTLEKYETPNKMRSYIALTMLEIMDMFTVFNCDLNTLFRDLKKEHNAQPKSNN